METPSNQPSETSTEAPADWPLEDKIWLQRHVPEPLRKIAIKYGRRFFQLVMKAGACSHALGVIANQNPGNRAVGQALAVLARSSNELCVMAVEACGKKMPDFAACKQEIELIAALHDTGEAGDKLTSGRIIIPGRGNA